MQFAPPQDIEKAVELAMQFSPLRGATLTLGFLHGEYGLALSRDPLSAVGGGQLAKAEREERLRR